MSEDGKVHKIALLGLGTVGMGVYKLVEERQKDVELFLKERMLNTCSNVQFGEGGAGTFSDGKLTTNLHSPLCNRYIC